MCLGFWSFHEPGGGGDVQTQFPWELCLLALDFGQLASLSFLFSRGRQGGRCSSTPHTPGWGKRAEEGRGQGLPVPGRHPTLALGVPGCDQCSVAALLPASLEPHQPPLEPHRPGFVISTWAV